MEQLLLDFLAQYPFFAQIVMYVGMARLILKPLQNFLLAVVEAIPGTKDNEMLQALFDSKIYKGLAYILDWFGSVKLPQAK